MQTTTPLTEALTRYLDLASDQMKLTATNMANIDTPGYKTLDFDFEQEFQRQQEGLDLSGPSVAEVNGLVARPDGNNVSIDREGMKLAATQLKFRMGMQLLKNEFATVLEAIQAEAK